MKRIIKVVLILLIIGVGGFAAYVAFALPDVAPAPNINVNLTPERIKHGEYLATHVAACMDCHSSRDWSRFSGPLKDGTLGNGGEYFGPEMGFPGKFYAKNLTPTHLGNWTDGEIFRAITSGVNKEGKALFPVMPYPYYNKMDREDILAIIAYIRSLPAISNDVQDSKANFPINFIMNTVPKKFSPVAKPDTLRTVEYGAYLVNMAACMECHTQADRGKLIMDQAFAGGRAFNQPNGVVRSANITPDSQSGIGGWTDSLFVDRFKSFEHQKNIPSLASGQLNTVMPWSMYAGMKRKDLLAIFTYLKTLKPISNEVIRYERHQ